MDVAGDEFFAWWQRKELRDTTMSTRPTLDDERGFWERRAAIYDQVGSLARAAPAVVARVTELVIPGAALIEIGPGTGEFTIPAARRAGRVTAVDLSAHMLAELHRKLGTAGLTNVTAREGDWEAADIAPHDVLLAVNSLYRLRDPRTAFAKLVHSATRRGILVNSVGANPPPTSAAVDHFGRERYHLGSRHGLLVAGLAELGMAADVEIFGVPRTYDFPSIADAAGSLLPWRDPTPVETDAAERIVRQTMELQPGGSVTHRYQGQVAVITWNAESKRLAE